jgi:hypothetical protein
MEGYQATAQLASPSLVWLYTVFTDKTTTAVTNEWNRANRHTVAYIDVDGNSNLDMNLYVTGITRDNLETHIIQFRDDLLRWVHILAAPPKVEIPSTVSTGGPKQAV